MSTISWKLSLVPAAALAVLPVLSGCEEVECGDGTVEIDGICEVDVGFDPDDPTCGAGTHAENGECVPDLPPAVCEDGTTAPELQPDGTILCVGTGGSGCGTVRCESPSGGKVSMCGQMFDVETGAPLRREMADGSFVCDPSAPTEDPLDPCSLEIEFYDPLAFAANPTGTAPLDADVIEINDCGHFKGINITRPFNGFMATSIDDASSADNKRRSAIAFQVEIGDRDSTLRAFVMDRSTDDAWTSTAGDPFSGQTFADVGVYVPVFRNPGPEPPDPPVEGVVIIAAGTTRPNDDFYFDDTDPELKSSVAPAAAQSSTGPNGTGLLVRSNLGQHSAMGGEPSGCQWESELAVTIPTVMFFRETFLHAAGAPDEDCVQ